MKFILIAFITFLVAAAANDEEPKQEKSSDRQNFLKEIADECMKEVGIEKEEAMKLMSSNLENVSQEGKCFLKCIFVKEGFFDEDEKPRPEYVLEALKDPQNIQMMQSCMKKDGKDSCDLAYNILNCYLKSSQEKFRRQREQQEAENSKTEDAKSEL